MKMENLNNSCPFGERSTKNFSAEEKTPNIHEANLANKVINQSLGNFVDYLESSPKKFTPLPISTYNIWARDDANVQDHYPKDLTEILPIARDRNAETIIKSLYEINDPFVESLLRLHDAYFKKDASHVRASREVMHLLQKNFSFIFKSPVQLRSSLVDSLSQNIIEDKSAVMPGSRHDPDVDVGVPVDSDLKNALIKYQSLQERFENENEIVLANDLFAQRPDVIETILGIQSEICKRIEERKLVMPEMNNYSIAFSEIANFNYQDEKVYPSPRFLKILVHNWGKYFSAVPNETVNKIIYTAVTSALADEIYRQNIFIFRNINGNLTLDGVTPKVCPARTLVGRMVNHYL